MKFNINSLANDTRVFDVDPTIQVQNVSFENRYGFVLAGHLYLPKNFALNQKYAAIVISGPFGAVKEQSSGLYAQTLAKRGFVTLAFDQSTTGESSGSVRNMASPDIFVEDFSSAVDFIGTQEFVDREKIGALGICGLGSHALTAAAIDVRIKAVATSVMYDMSESMWQGLNNSKTEEQREIEKQYLAELRWKEIDQQERINGYHEVPFDEDNHPIYADKLFPDELPADADSVTREFYNYYIKRAYHPRSVNSASAWDATTPWGYYVFPLQQNIGTIKAPKLIVTGEKAHSRYMAEESFNQLKDPKQLIIVPGATHTDLYDQMNLIPFDDFENFFRENLK